MDVVIALVYLVLAFGAGMVVQRARQPKPKPAMTRSEYVEKAKRFAMELFEEERASIGHEERTSEYNRGYRQALEDCFLAGFPEMERTEGRGGYQSYAVAGRHLGHRPDGRLTLRAGP